MKRIMFFLTIILALVGTASADVIRLVDGKILLGKVTGSEAGVSVVELGDQKKIVPQSDILKTEPDLQALKSRPVDVYLKDGSVLTGKIKDFDADVGLLLDIAFGSLTLPFTSIDHISDPVQRNYYNGFPVKIGLAGGYYFGIGDSRASFSDNFDVTLYTEINPGLLRGLFLGVSFSYLNLSYLPNAALGYLVIDAQVHVTYRLLVFRSSSSFLKPFVPYVSAGAGGAYVSTWDPRSGYASSTRSELDFSFSGSLGIDIFIWDNFLVKVEGKWLSIMQAGGLFNTLSANLGAAFCF